MSTRVQTAAVLVLVAWSSAASADPLGLDPATLQSLGGMHTLVLACDSYRLDHESYPGPTEGFVTVELLRPHLSPVYVRDLPTLDGWGHPFLYAAATDGLAIVTHGPDGKPDREYVSLAALEPAEGGGDDLVWSGGHLIVCPTEICRLERLGNQKATMADLRSIATAVEAYKIDQGAYPRSDGWVPVAVIRPHVEPSYIRTLPLADAWGNTLLYSSDGQRYRIASPGADGAADAPYDDVVPGTTTGTFSSDIVFGDGQFLQWPAGDQR
jgi:general secretion pathway protein G